MECDSWRTTKPVNQTKRLHLCFHVCWLHWLFCSLLVVRWKLLMLTASRWPSASTSLSSFCFLYNVAVSQFIFTVFHWYYNIQTGPIIHSPKLDFLNYLSVILPVMSLLISVPVSPSREAANTKIDKFPDAPFPSGGTVALLRPRPRHRGLWSQASVPSESLWRSQAW